MSLYEDLGLEPGATEAAIRAAWRRYAREHHPDRGGDEAVFKRGEAAYAVLSDPEKRRRYDESGSAAGPTQEQRDAELRKAIDSTLTQLVQTTSHPGQSLEHRDWGGHVRSALSSQRAQLAGSLADLERRLARVKALRQRFKRKQHHSATSTFVMEAFDAQVDRARAPIPPMKEALLLQDRLIEAFGSFEYDYSPADSSFRDPTPEEMRQHRVAHGDAGVIPRLRQPFGSY